VQARELFQILLLHLSFHLAGAREQRKRVRVRVRSRVENEIHAGVKLLETFCALELSYLQSTVYTYIFTRFVL